MKGLSDLPERRRRRDIVAVMPMRNQRKLKILLICFCLCAALPAQGAELTFMGGLIRNTNSHDVERAIQFEYSKDIADSLALSLSWVNEGHFVEHHRDGLLVQLWWKRTLSTSRVVLKGGGGGYLYFDTTERFTGPYFRNKHGAAAVFSAAAEWHFSNSLFLQGRVNWIVAQSNMDSLSFLLGPGIELDRGITGVREKAPVTIGLKRNEFMPFFDYMISNNSDSQEAVGWGAEYRRRIRRHLDGTLSWLDEGNNDVFHRRGLAAQLWFTDGFYGDRLTLAIGFGPYLAWNRYPDRLTGKDGNVLAGLVSASFSYRFNETWAVRGTWNRVVTDYDRDTDVITVGPSYRF